MRRPMSVTVAVVLRINLVFAICLRPRTLAENRADHWRSVSFQFPDCRGDVRHLIAARTRDQNRAGGYLDDRRSVGRRQQRRCGQKYYVVIAQRPVDAFANESEGTGDVTVPSTLQALVRDCLRYGLNLAVERNGARTSRRQPLGFAPSNPGNCFR